MNQRAHFKQAGFSLIEIMIVVIIIGTLAAMVMPRLLGRSEQAKVAAAKADISVSLPTALKLYSLDNGHFPTMEEGGLDALVNKPASASNWNGPYIEKPARDPWKHDYIYKFPGTHRTYDYDLSSQGSDGEEGTDDINNWDVEPEAQ